MNVSEKGLAFIAAHEGLVTRAYLDPVGIVTIGYGFTMGSGAFSNWWQTRHGRGLRLGDTLSRADADRLLMKLLKEEYAPAVARKLSGLSQPAFDACVSVIYNLGPRALGWKWAQALAGGGVKEAARLLAKTGTTAGGRRLRGLVHRRKQEADLLLHGTYGPAAGMAFETGADSDLSRIQKMLAAVGYDPGPFDGLDGPLTRRAVKAFQTDHPPLVVDGVPGPATRAALHRATQKTKATKTAIFGAVSTFVGGLLAGWTWSGAVWVASAMCLSVLAASFIWRFRGRIAVHPEAGHRRPANGSLQSKKPPLFYL